jgi:hypothetical protein
MNALEKYSSLLGEILFPLIGFLFFDWGFYFILLFILFDRCAKLLFLNARLKRSSIQKNLLFTAWLNPTTKQKTTVSQIRLVSFLLFFAECAAVHIGCTFLLPDFDILLEFSVFWTYEEMGIQQGYLLVPALFLAEWMSTKRDFNMPLYDGANTVKTQNNLSMLRSLFLLSLIGIYSMFKLEESILICLFLCFYFIIIWFDVALLPKNSAH